MAVEEFHFDCGCDAIRNTDDGEWAVNHCPLHAAAGDLLAACKASVELAVGMTGDQATWEQLRAAIAKAEPKADKVGG